MLEGYLNLSGGLSGGTLGAKKGELIAMAVAEANNCNYCLSAHAFIGEKLVGIDTTSIRDARSGKSIDAKTEAVLTFAKTLVSKRGLVSDADVNAVKAAGVTEGEVGEIVGHVALNILTNYFTNTANTEVDFPEVTAFKAAA